jgi:hypothetical protein
MDRFFERVRKVTESFGRFGDPSSGLPDKSRELAKKVCCFR